MIDRARTIVGWMMDDELRWLAGQASRRSLIAEIGSWRGRSTAALSDNTSGLVVAVDTWRGSKETDEDPGFKAGGEDWLVAEFSRHAGPNVVPLRLESTLAATTFSDGTFDMIFIDGAHDYDSVRADLLAWRPKLAPGGLFCGHDYFTSVKEAVDALFEVRTPAGTIWERVSDR